MASVMTDAYTLDAREVGHTIRPRGPLGHEPRDTPHGTTVAIGFCPRCGTNARRTTTVRGIFDCPECSYQWYDARVGDQHHSIDDFFSSA